MEPGNIKAKIELQDAGLREKIRRLTKAFQDGVLVGGPEWKAIEAGKEVGQAELNLDDDTKHREVPGCQCLKCRHERKAGL